MTLGRRARHACLMIVSALVGWACGPAAAEDWNAVEAAARKEGEVLLYHNFSPTSAEQVIAAFNKAYPAIAVSEVRLPSAAFYQRFGTEYAGGRTEADICSSAWDDRLEEWMREGWMAEWSPPEAAALAPEMRFGNRMWAIQVVREMIIYNKGKVKAADAPKDWPDLFDAKWKGRVGMNPPWRSVGPQSTIAFLEKKFALKDMPERLQSMDVRFFNGSAGVIQATARGDVDVALLTDLPLNAALGDGMPLGAVYPKSGVPYTPIVSFVPAKVKHPNAAKVMLNWLLGAAGQTTIQELSGAPGTRPDIPAPKYVPANRDLALVNHKEVLTPDDQRRIVEQWRSVFKVQ
jgi:iron(III) transport system substrate-binding protein